MTEFLKNNFLMVLVFVGSGIMFLWPEIQKLLGRGVAEKSSFDAIRMMNDGAAILDVRTQDEFNTGFIAKSKNFALVDLEKHLGSFAKDKPLLVVCSNGIRSRMAARTLKKNGFSQVFALAGGVAEWVKAGMPIEKKK
jgi:rhodanese-related sulfurtransferase